MVHCFLQMNLQKNMNWFLLIPKALKNLQKVGILIHHLLLELFMKKEVGLTHSSVIKVM